MSFPTWSTIYVSSKIDHHSYYEACMTLSVRTSNSFEQIEQMEFYKFNLLMKYLNIYIENENKKEQGNPEDAEAKKDELMQQSSKQMAEAKRNMPKAPPMGKYKTPNMTIPKLKR